MCTPNAFALQVVCKRLLIGMFINYLDARIESFLSKFANNAKLGMFVNRKDNRVEYRRIMILKRNNEKGKGIVNNEKVLHRQK